MFSLLQEHQSLNQTIDGLMDWNSTGQGITIDHLFSRRDATGFFPGFPRGVYLGTRTDQRLHDDGILASYNVFVILVRLGCSQKPSAISFE